MIEAIEHSINQHAHQIERQLADATREWYGHLEGQAIADLRGHALTRDDIRRAMGMAHVQTLRMIARSLARGVAEGQARLAAGPAPSGLSPALSSEASS